MYLPDYWCILKIDSHEPHYRVFGTWAGGYTYGSSWRMNSGIVKVEDVGDSFDFYGSSGSIYRCHKKMYGCHWESQGELNRVLNHEAYSSVPEETNWLELDWMIE